MKQKIIISIIVLCGITLSVLKYNGFDIWNLPRITFNTILLSSSVLFLLGIIILNTSNNQKKVREKEGSEIEPKNSFLPTDYIKSLSERTKYYLITIGISLVLVTYLGFKYKNITDGYILNLAAKKENKWQSDLLFESYKSNDNFFTLKGYSFNWEIFIISFIILFAIAYFIRNTVYYEKIKDYLKSIKRK